MPYVFKMPTLMKPAPPVGNFRARCIRVSTTNDEGVQLQSKNGDAQIRLTLELNTAYETSALLTLPSLDGNGDPISKSGTALLRILGQVLKAFGNEAEEHQQCEIGSKSFLGKECDVTITEREYNGKKYLNVSRWAPKGTLPLEQKETENDDLPF
jgi:hypothetical protein